MDTLTESLSTVNEAVTKAVTAMQSQVVALHRDAAAAVAKVGEPPSWLPSVEPLPSVDELVEQAFDFQAQRLEAGKQFALELLECLDAEAGAARSQDRQVTSSGWIPSRRCGSSTCATSAGTSAPSVSSSQLSQRQLANLTDLSDTYMSQLERGSTSPRSGCSGRSPAASASIPTS